MLRQHRSGAQQDAAGKIEAREWAIAAVALLALAFLTRFATFGHPDLHVDETFYFASGVEVAKGAIPFVDVWDRKPPGHFLLFAAIAVFSDNYLAYQIAAMLFAGATALAVYALARNLVAHWQALAGGAIYLLSLCLFNGQGGQSPVFYNHFMALAAAVLLAALPRFDSRRGGFLVAGAMLLAGVAITIKTTAVFEALFFGLFAAALQIRSTGLGRATVLRAAIWAALGALPTAAFALWYALHGYWDEYWTAMVLSNLRKPVEDNGGLQRLWVLGLMALPLLAACGVALLNIRGPKRLFFGGWVLAALVGFFSVPAFYLHYALPLLVSLCALAPAGLAWPRAGAFLLGSAAVIPVLFYSFFDFADTREAKAAMARLVDAVERGRDGGPLLVYDGPPLLYTLTGTRFPTPLAFPNHLHQASERDVSHIATLPEVERLLALRPGVIVDRTTAVTNQKTAELVRAYERKHCTLLASEPMMKGWDIEVLVYGNCRDQAPK
jgi:4-amino-4-deoxy-L-arabinose transferase-like glycosyltransferase